jgi:hypothetical protein
MLVKYLRGTIGSGNIPIEERIRDLILQMEKHIYWISKRELSNGE